MKTLRISAAAKSLDISTSRLRYLERKGALRSQRISPNGWRAYPVGEVARLKKLNIS